MTGLKSNDIIKYIKYICLTLQLKGRDCHFVGKCKTQSHVVYKKSILCADTGSLKMMKKTFHANNNQE